MGSSLRYGYTALGDAVNLAARLEGLNKEYGTHILISESTRQPLHTGKLMFREIDFIRVKGKLQPVTIYEILGPRIERTSGEGTCCIIWIRRAKRTSVTIGAPQDRFWAVLQRWPDDGPSRILLARCDGIHPEEPPASIGTAFT